MPQFEPTYFASQLFWLYVSFTLLLIMLSVFALPKISGVLEDRQKRIDGNLDKAGQLKAEAQAAIAAYEKAMADSRAEAHKIMQEAAAAISAQAASRQKQLGDKLATQVKAGEARIQAAKDQAMGEIRTVSAELVRVTLEKLIGQSADDAKVTAAIADNVGGQG